MGESDARRLAGIGSSGSGWHEGKQPTPDGDKAIEHQVAAAKAAIAQSAPLKVPIIQMHQKPQVTVAQGWRATTDGYTYNRLVHEEHTATNYMQYIMNGEVKGDFGTVILWTYDKDVTELKEKKEKASILEARLSSYIPSDPAYVTVSQELHHTLHEAEMLKKGIEAEVDSETVLEDRFYRNNTLEEGGGYEKWVEEFMKKANAETEQVISRLKKKDPIKL
jgi:hypothetical protein